MLDRFPTTLQSECYLEKDRPLLVGVSGGPDSLCLLDVLRRLDYRLVVAHLDHALRPESAEEALTVKRLAESQGAACVIKRQDVNAFAELHGLSLEEAARNVRYQFLFEQAQLYQAQAVAVGHTADDQVETVLMHILRGAGLSGLKGMAFRSLPNSWSQDIPLVRPLLGTWREEVLAYCQANALKPNLDLSNQDIRFYRNRLRRDLIPYLKDYNPRVREVLWRTARLLNDDFAILEHATSLAWQACLRVRSDGAIAFDLQGLREQPVGLQRHLLRRAINWLRPGLRDIDFDAIEHALEFLVNPPRSRRRDLIAGLSLLIEENQFWLFTWEADLPNQGWPQVLEGDVRRLDVPGVLPLGAGWRLSAEITTDVEGARQLAYTNADPFQAWLDNGELNSSLLVRSRQPGDRFRPLGMGGKSLKLADFLVNVKLPRRARAAWPLVVSQDEIVWVPGFRLAHPVRLRGETEEVIKIKLARE
jgi:tRNA(Ile)-lysidine synthase